MFLKKDEYTVLGIMSGTSLDGLDMAICKFKLESDKWSFKIEKSKVVLYPSILLGQLKNAFNSSASEIAKLHSTFGAFIGVSATEFIKESQIEVDLIASHGQTIFHAPELRYTLQIGNGAEIAAKSGVLTVCDFRSLDVARGGQGAPLVPIGDKLLFSDYAACLNLGGFSNISFDDNKGDRVAYDICPVNFVLNYFANKLNLEYDEGGAIAVLGDIDTDLLGRLNQIEYYRQPAPKSLGQEWVEENIFPHINPSYQVKDVLRTFCEHVATQISKELSNINGDLVLITGGGAYNTFLIKLIEQKCVKNLVIPGKELIDMKEALIFAFLGVLRCRGENNSLASVTGASQNSINGAVYLP